MTKLLPATEKDIEQISHLAKIIWNDHYTSIIGTEQLNYMLNMMYSNESILNQMTNLNHQFYLIEKENSIVGFLSISSKNNRDYNIHKFYVLQNQSNLGSGTSSLNHLIHLIKPKSLSLYVNRKNYKSINFYFKNGFKIDRVEDIDIGNGYEMNDFLMIRYI